MLRVIFVLGLALGLAPVITTCAAAVTEQTPVVAASSEFPCGQPATFGTYEIGRCELVAGSDVVCCNYFDGMLAENDQLVVAFHMIACQAVCNGQWFVMEAQYKKLGADLEETL